MEGKRDSGVLLLFDHGHCHCHFFLIVLMVPAFVHLLSLCRPVLVVVIDGLCSIVTFLLFFFLSLSSGACVCVRARARQLATANWPLALMESIGGNVPTTTTTIELSKRLWTHINAIVDRLR